jgi:hypothetical protein
MAKVLALDDQPIRLVGIKVGLESFGHEVTDTTEAQKAWDYLKTPFDVMICSSAFVAQAEAIASRKSNHVILLSPDPANAREGMTFFDSSQGGIKDLDEIIHRLLTARPTMTIEEIAEECRVMWLGQNRRFRIPEGHAPVEVAEILATLSIDFRFDLYDDVLTVHRSHIGPREQ